MLGRGCLLYHSTVTFLTDLSDVLTKVTFQLLLFCVSFVCVDDPLNIDKSPSLWPES